jgi:hypothetical protein
MSEASRLSILAPIQNPRWLPWQILYVVSPTKHTSAYISWNIAPTRLVQDQVYPLYLDSVMLLYISNYDSVKGQTEFHLHINNNFDRNLLFEWSKYVIFCANDTKWCDLGPFCDVMVFHPIWCSNLTGHHNFLTGIRGTQSFNFNTIDSYIFTFSILIFISRLFTFSGHISGICSCVMKINI